MGDPSNLGIKLKAQEPMDTAITEVGHLNSRNLISSTNLPNLASTIPRTS